MIRYALHCEHEHEFEAWFASGAAFDEQGAGGEVQCPVCGSHDVVKALMAPSISKSGSKKLAGPAPENIQKMQVMMSALRQHVQDNCDYVGEQFAEEARRIHYGEADKRDIYGEATLDEARELVEEGVELMPLPGATTPKAS